MAKTPKRPRDVSKLAKMMVDIAVSEGASEEKVNLRSANAAKRGAARAAALTPEQRAEIARVAAHTRWKKSD